MKRSCLPACIPLFALGVCVCLTSCTASRTGADAVIERDAPPAYRDIAERFNERADRLGRLWANATVQFSFLEEDGDRREEQGEGHFQFIAPDKLAISVGKIGEVLFWLGCDEERYWFFELHDAQRAAIGRHENVGRPCNRDLGLPANPLDVIELLGVTPLDPEVPGEVSWSLDGQWLVVDAPGQGAWRRLFLDPDTMLPERVELYDPEFTDAPLVHSTIELYDRVELTGVGGFMPKAPSRLQIDHPESGTSIRLFLHSLGDGRTRGRLSDAVFDFDTLVEAYGPDEIDVLDERCASPALTR